MGEIERWNVYFELDSKQANVFLTSMHIYGKLCCVELRNAFRDIFTNYINKNVDYKFLESDCWDIYDDYLYKYNVNIDLFSSVKQLRRKFTKKIFKGNDGGKVKFHVELTMQDVFTIDRMIETLMRIALGQWWQLDILLDDIFKENKLEYRFKDHRDDITNLYENHGLSHNGSFSIYSKELNDDIRILYDIKNTLRFECFGEAFAPKSASMLGLPKIDFPMHFMMIFNGDDMAAEKVLPDSKRYSDCPDLLWLPIGEYKYHVLKKGCTVYRKRNGFYVLKGGEFYEL